MYFELFVNIRNLRILKKGGWMQSAFGIMSTCCFCRGPVFLAPTWYLKLPVTSTPEDPTPSGLLGYLHSCNPNPNPSFKKNLFYTSKKKSLKRETVRNEPGMFVHTCTPNHTRLKQEDHLSSWIRNYLGDIVNPNSPKQKYKRLNH